MSTVTAVEETSSPQRRAAIPIHRTHQRFLLRHLEFTHQYAAMYKGRLEALQQRALRAIHEKVRACGTVSGTGSSLAQLSRVLELFPGQRAICVGVLYKQMPLLPRFLDEYQKELIRIDIGEEDDEGSGLPNISYDMPLAGNGEIAQDLERQCVTLCSAKDELFMEDSSGRVLLMGIPVELLCTGLVLGVDGTLEKNGRLQVHNYALPDVREIYVPRLLPRILKPTPCYVGFVCGLSLGCLQMQDPEVVRSRTMVELLVEYLSGNLGDDTMVMQASRIARLVIAGNSIAPTDDLRLKKKVKLDPSDHVRLGDERQGSGVVTSAMLMAELDTILARIADTIEVELMPGEDDMANAFQPQQPIHPLLLPEAARRSSLRLVTNPYEFSLFPGENVTAPSEASPGVTEASGRGTIFFTSSGCTLNDVSRETSYPTRLDTMSMLFRSGCPFPTAPNTLFSYPFKNFDPFIFPHAPHCFLCCDQPEMQTRWEPFSSFAPTADNSLNNEEFMADENAGVRLICVPPFSKTGTLVLVDVNAPQLDTVVVNFATASNNAL